MNKAEREVRLEELGLYDDVKERKEQGTYQPSPMSEADYSGDLVVSDEVSGMGHVWTTESSMNGSRRGTINQTGFK